MKAATMLVVMAVVVVLMMGVSVEGRRRKDWLNRRGCRRPAGQGVMQEGAGQSFVWTMTGLDEDDLRMTYHLGAFAPEGSTVVFLFPRDRGPRALDLVPAKLVYDFTDPANPVVAVRKARRGRGVCIVMSSDVSTYDTMITELQQRNVTNRDVLSEDEAEQLEALAADPSQFSQTLRDICSQDLCGNPVNTLYFWAEDQQTAEEGEEGEGEEENNNAALPPHSVMLFNDRVDIFGLMPRRRMWRHGRRGQGHAQGHGQGQDHVGAGGNQRQNRRQNRRQQRRERRQRRRQQAGEV